MRIKKEKDNKEQGHPQQQATPSDADIVGMYTRRRILKMHVDSRNICRNKPII